MSTKQHLLMGYENIAAFLQIRDLLVVAQDCGGATAEADGLADSFELSGMDASQAASTATIRVTVGDWRTSFALSIGFALLDVYLHSIEYNCNNIHKMISSIGSRW